MSEAKRYASIKKVSLAGVSEEWNEDCYAYVVPAGYEDQQEIIAADLENKSNSEQIAYQVDFVRRRFVRGKIKVFNGEEFELADMTVDDTVASVAICDALYAGIMGFDLDPKDIREVARDIALQKKSSKTTETTSSEA